jgi:hypothetical protein
VAVGTGLLTALYLATPKETKEKLTGSFRRGAEK